MPAGLEVTVPLPVPAFVTVRVTAGSKAAVQLLPAFMVTTPSEQSGSPLQPVNAELASGVGVRVTSIPPI